MPVNQLPWTRERLVQILGGFNDYELAALGVIVPALGSLILGLALAAGQVSAPEVCAAALLDELWQEAQWGADDEAALRRAKIIEDVAICADFMALCGA
jgi:chaperone required for assembly of F1-ATPase